MENINTEKLNNENKIIINKNELNNKKISPKKEKEIKSINEKEKDINESNKNKTIESKDIKNTLSNSQSFQNKNYKTTYSSKSKKSTKTKKSIKKEKYHLDKSNQAYIYIKELKISKEIIEKRTKTANLIKQRLINQNSKNNFKNSVMFRPTLNKISQEKKVLNNHKKQLEIMNDPSNPYSIYYPNKILEERYNVEIGVKGFINGVPIIDVRKKKEEKKPRKHFEVKKIKYYNISDDNDSYYQIKNNKENINHNSSKEINKKNDEIIDNYEDNNFNDNKNINNEEDFDDDNINEEMNKMFNTNQQNFFKFRKDIKEGILYIFNLF